MGRKMGETWEEFCQREILESQDDIRLYRGMTAIVPLLRALPEVGNIDSLLNEMAICTYVDARKELVRWLRGHWGNDSVAPILSAFDTYSV